MKKEKTFEEKYKSYKEGKSEAPTLYKDVRFKINSEKQMIILSVEEIDSDGEVVEMEGGSIRDKEAGIPMIDSHNSHSSVTQNGLGAVRNPMFTTVAGKKALVGEPDFAPTPNGKIAEILYKGVNGGKPYFTNVSMGFIVYDYDNETRRIKQWEVFELSLVTVGANKSARFVGKEFSDEQVAKDLARFKAIKDPFKEFTKLFLSDEFCKKINYELDGNLEIDINNIYDIVSNKFEVKKEAPKEPKEAPKEQEKTPEVSPELVDQAIKDAISKKLEELV